VSARRRGGATCPRSGRVSRYVHEISCPVRGAALVRAAKADDAVARALLAKHNPVLVAAVAEGRSEGRAEGRVEALRDAILLVLAQRGLAIEVDQRARILAGDRARLELWLERAVTCASAAELFV